MKYELIRLDEVFEVHVRVEGADVLPRPKPYSEKMYLPDRASLRWTRAGEPGFRAYTLESVRISGAVLKNDGTPAKASKTSAHARTDETFSRGTYVHAPLGEMPEWARRLWEIYDPDLRATVSDEG